MFCGNCGAVVEEGAEFCGNCGAKIENAISTEMPDQRIEPSKKKYGIIKVIAVILILCIGIGICKKSNIFNSDIRTVKHGTLFQYDNDVNIGDSLHTWFDGKEEWASYKKGDTVYVEAYGYTPYGINGKEWQKFVFTMDDVDGRFTFRGAYDGNEQYIWTSASDFQTDWSIGLLNDIYSYAGIGNTTYELAISAAFGNEDALQSIKNFCNQQNGNGDL